MEMQNFEVNAISAVSAGHAISTAKQIPTVLEIQEWIVSYLAELLEIAPKEVDVKIPFDRYGLDSSAAVGLTGDLQDWLGYEVEPTLLYDYPTIESLAQHLSTNLN